jgi:hypothetical protein
MNIDRDGKVASFVEPDGVNVARAAGVPVGSTIVAVGRTRVSTKTVRAVPGRLSALSVP